VRDVYADADAGMPDRDDDANANAITTSGRRSQAAVGLPPIRLSTKD
jgi:hypothetical protein